MINDQGTIMKQKAECPEGPAYQVNRRAAIRIDATDSVNTKGVSSNIDIYMQPQNDDIFQKSTLQYRFQELGCQFVDVTVKDNENNQTSTMRAWFLVTNALPRIQDITLSFPQHG